MSRSENNRRLEPAFVPSFALRIGVSLGALAALAMLIRCNSTVEPSLRREHVRPQVSQTAPAADAVGVSPQATITVVFSEPMDAATIHPATYRVSAAGLPQAGVIAGLARRFTFTPFAALPENQLVEVEIRDVADAAGNMLAEPYRFAFRTATGAPLPPRPPSNPNPADDATGVSVNPVFTWLGGSASGDPVTYDVLLGTSQANLTLRAQDLTETSFAAGPLADAIEYFWQIIARSEGLETSGPIWSFTTEAGNQPPPAPCNPEPDDGELGVPTAVSLSWQCLTDPDGDPLIFDIYLGTETNPPLVAAGVDGPPFSPEAPLLEGTQYHWRVVARDGQGGTTSGPVWTFQTLESNDPPTEPAPPITPPHRAMDIDLNVDLTWSGGDDPDGDPVTYEVRFGRSDPPPFLDTVTVKTYHLENLDPQTRYRWQIVARDDHGHSSPPSPVWRFDTQAAPSVPCDPDPDDGAKSVPIIVDLKWACGVDPVDAVTFDVYFGNTPDPPFLNSTQEHHYGPFAVGISTYYWRIVARDSRGAQSEGPVWSFMTGLGPEGAERGR